MAPKALIKSSVFLAHFREFEFDFDVDVAAAAA
jgi:hypothetical protein